MRELVINQNDNKINVEQNKFIRDKNKWVIRTETMNKQGRKVYDKRILLSNFETLPYGY